MRYFIIINGPTSFWRNHVRFNSPRTEGRLVYNLIRYEGPMAVFEFGVMGECLVDTRDKNVSVEMAED